MNLSPDEVSEFFRLLWAVYFHVNRRFDLVKEVESVAALQQLPQSEKLRIRKVLWDSLPEWFDDFVEANPCGLDPDGLKIIRGWKHFVAGDFYVFKFLRKHAIFMTAEGSPNVYAVQGINDPIEAMLPQRRLPILVRAVLLPFKGRIVHDGIMEPYAISFGAGIRDSLNERYQKAKGAGTLVESLTFGGEPVRTPPKNRPVKDWGPLLQEIEEKSEMLKQAASPVQSRAFTVLKASARLARTAGTGPNDLELVAMDAKLVQRALRQLDTALRQAGWYGKW